MFTVWIATAMGGVPTKEHQDIIERLERIESAVGGAGERARARPDGIVAPSPPSKRGAQFVEGDSPTHGSPAGAKFRAKLLESAESPAERPADVSKTGPKFALPDDNKGQVTPGESPRSGGLPSHSGAKSAAKTERQSFFGGLRSMDDWRAVEKCPGVKCSWLAAACAALSFASGTAVRMEDVLRTNEVALHYVSMPAVTTAEVYDLIAEYIKANRELRDKVGVDIANFDSEILDEDEQIGDENGSGDRPPVQSLIQFRKTLQAELNDESYSVHVLNYDPYPVQEAESKAKEDEEALAELEEEEDEEKGDALASSMSARAKKQQQKQYQPRNMGAFSILTNYNPALHAVSIATPHLGPDGAYTLETHQCPLQTIYNACCVKDGYTKRTRGFIRVFRLAEGGSEKCVKSKYPTALVDGRQSRGMLSIALDISIAPHILGLGLLHEVVRSTILTEEQVKSCKVAGAGIELRGIPVTDICQRLELPVGTIVATATRDSLPTATVWYKRYLKASGLENQVDVGCVSVTRRDDAEDGAVNIDEDEFKQFIADASAAGSTAVLLAFNVNIAKNVRVVPDGQSPTHFALLMGYDASRELVQLADVSVKKFRKTWHTTADLLYRAVIGHGFIVAAKSGDALANTFDARESAAALMPLARYGVHVGGSIGAIRRAPSFEHPAKNYSMTVLAKGLNAVLGAPQVRVEDLIYRSGFHISFMLSEHLPLLATQRAANYYCYYALEDKVFPEAKICDPGSVSQADFEAAVAAACDPKAADPCAVLVNYNGAALNRFPTVWNGSFGGNLALVVGYDAGSKTLLLSDSNPEPFHREWTCPVDVMMQCMSEVDPIADRARGFLVLRKGGNPMLKDSRLIDMRRAQSHHPFKNPVSSVASAVALALSEVIPGSAVASEDIVYAGGNFSLTTLTSNVTPEAALAMADDWAAQNPNNRKRVKFTLMKDGFSDAEAFIKAVGHQADRVSLVLYDAANVFPGVKEAGLAAGVINRAIAGRDIVVTDGSPTKHGDVWARAAETLAKSVKAIIHFDGLQA